MLAEAVGQKPLVISSASGLGVDGALGRLADVIGAAKREEIAVEPEPAWQP
jgi:GTP-binding protein